MKKNYYQYFICLLLLLNTYQTSIAQNWAQIQKIVASDRATNDHFGSVAISGDYAIIGAGGDDEDVAGGNTLNNSGAAYIYKNDGMGNWLEIQKIVASDRGADDGFGNVSINGDYAFVGASLEDEDVSGGNTMSDAGAVYIYKNDGMGNWSEVQKIVASDRKSSDNFGRSTSSSGDYLIIGALYEDEDASGGNKMLQAGSAYIFKKDAMGNWSETQKVVASDRAVNDQFGWSVGMSGDYAIVGAPAEDEDETGGNSMGYAGSAYIYKKDAMGNWSEVQKIVASDRGSTDSYGFKVDISGDYAIVGSYWEDEDVSGGNTLSKSGSAYIYKKDAMDNWSEAQKLVASDRGVGEEFGRSVSINGDYAIVGAWKQDEALFGGFTLSDAGAAYIFKKDAMGNWAEDQRVIANDREKSDFFGTSVSISGGYAIVGAYQEDHDISGGNSLTGAGSAYVFSTGSICPTGTYALPNNPILSGTYHGADDLLTNATINNSEKVILIGGTSVTLQAGFYATLGSDFSAKLGDCSATFQSAATERATPNSVNRPKFDFEEDLNLAVLPNPVLYNATISYSLPQASKVQLAIYTINGQKMTTIFSGKQEVGFHAITMNTEQLSSGIYYMVLSTLKKSQHKKIIVMK